MFADAAETIAKAGLADETSGWRRLVIEKPFGTDLASALVLNEQLHRYWREDQIFRIDHFLGKETVQNILVFRFANRFVEPVLRAAHVDEIQITVAETLGVEGRSRYYDGIGALRDMIQNHLIQMMTISTMEPPALWDAEMIRDHKVEVLKAVRPLDPERRRGAWAVHRGAHRRQHRSSGTAPSRASTRRHAPRRSRRCALHLDTWRWEGVPVLMRSGKRLAAKAHEVAFRFQRAADPLVPPHAARARRAQLVGVPHEPDRAHRPRRAHEAARPRARSAGVGAERVVHADDDDDANEASAYEGLLLDVLEGDHTPFLRFDEVEWAWRIIDPILKAWQRPAHPRTTSPGSDGPTGQHRFLGPGHAWRPLVAARPDAATTSRHGRSSATRRGRRTGWRIADSTRSPKSAAPRDAKRPNSALAISGPARPRRPRPAPSIGPRRCRSPGPRTRRGPATRAATRRSGRAATTRPRCPRRHTSLTAARSMS